MNAYTKIALILILAPTLIGCWQEVHFDPSTEAPPQTPAVFVSSSKPATEPTQGSSFGETGRYDSTTPTIESEAPKSAPFDRPEAELPEPVWNESESEQNLVSPAKPAPAAELDWLEEETETDPAEMPSIVPLAMPWQLGSKWSLAIGIYGKGYGSDRYAGVMTKAEQAADELDVALPEIPAGIGEPLPIALEVLRGADGTRLAEEVGRSHSPQHEALCQLAIVTHAILLDYTADSDVLNKTANRIESLATNASLPEHLWQPVVDAIKQRAEFAKVKQAVLKLHRETAAYLESL